jgi:hypothetical protein
VKSLGFAPLQDRGQARNPKRVRPSRFESRSALPTSAACVVANGVRETLCALLGVPVTLRLLEPSIPSPAAWPVILRNARLYRVRGNVADATIVLRPADAIALAAILFGEHAADPAVVRALSPIECDVIDRMVAAIASNLGTVCGAREGVGIDCITAIGSCVTYFELLADGPVCARIGIALSRDPSPEPRGRLETGHLAGLRLRVRVSLDIGRAQAASVARLGAGEIVPIEPTCFQRCSLLAAGKKVARGGCGVRNGRYAFTVQAT